MSKEDNSADKTDVTLATVLRSFVFDIARLAGYPTSLFHILYWVSFYYSTTLL